MSYTISLADMETVNPNSEYLTLAQEAHFAWLKLDKSLPAFPAQLPLKLHASAVHDMARLICSGLPMNYIMNSPMGLTEKGRHLLQRYIDNPQLALLGPVVRQHQAKLSKEIVKDFKTMDYHITSLTKYLAKPRTNEMAVELKTKLYNLIDTIDNSPRITLITELDDIDEI